MIIILIGPIASGKGTYAELLSKKLRIQHISMGELLRQLSEKTKYGKELKKKYWSKGILVPDDITMDILQQSLGKKGFILDGFPRSLNQAMMLDKITRIDYVIYLKISNSTIIKRISGRLQCNKCGAIYNIYTYPPKNDRLCDNDKTKLYVRPDDADGAAIKERIKVFKNQTKAVIAHYKRKGILKEVDSEPGVEAVFKSILKVIGKR